MVIRKVCLIFLAVILMHGCFNRSYAASQDFTIFNRTGLDIVELFLAPYQTDDWQSEFFEGEILADGGRLDITFKEKRPETYWDIKVKDEEGNIFYWRKINLKETSVLTLYSDGNEFWVEAE
ncbi:MAG TPA: hypothetical protein PLH87_07550 [Bacillota bacterium]|nr:hypothetical protein [Bacillota bacterium]